MLVEVVFAGDPTSLACDSISLLATGGGGSGFHVTSAAKLKPLYLKPREHDMVVISVCVK